MPVKVNDLAIKKMHLVSEVNLYFLGCKCPVCWLNPHAGYFFAQGLGLGLNLAMFNCAIVK